MESLNRDLDYMELHSTRSYRGVKKPGLIYAWKTAHKLEPDLVQSYGGSPDMIRCYDNEFSTFQWWEGNFKMCFKMFFKMCL